MPKIFTDTALSKNRSVTGCDQKGPKTGYNGSRPQKTGF